MYQIIILILIIVVTLNLTKKNNSIKYINPIVVKKSKIAGRGVFANRDFKKDEIIEICPTLIENQKKIKGIFKDYYYETHAGKNKVVLPFGLCVFYNHSFNPNVYGYESVKKQKFTNKASRDIKKGEELTVNYGKNYWNSRKIIIK